jgi:histidinol-phosphate aminotransferase
VSLEELVRKPLRGEAPYHVPAQPGAIKLDANESPWPLSREALADVAAALADPALHRYPDASMEPLRAAIAAWVGGGVDANQVSLGNGSDETLGLLCAAFGERREEGTLAVPARVVVPWPGFVVYRTVAWAHGLDVVEVPLGPRFEPDVAALDAAIARTHANLVFLATPNNPTGTTWPKAEIARLVAAHPDVVFAVDEAYGAYADEPSSLDLALARDNVILVGTLSKIGLAGLRVGYAIGRRWAIGELEKVRPPYNLDTLSQRAALVLLTRHADELRRHHAAVRSERARLVEALARFSALEVFPTQANFVCVRAREASRIHQALVERGVLVRCFDRPGISGPLAGCLRITVGTPEEDDALLAALAAVLG